MQNIIWTNDTGQIDAIIEEWRQEALSLAVDMAKNPKETVDEATYGVDVILNKAWKNIVDGYEIPTAQRLFETINSLDILDARIRIAADELNTEYRADEQDNLRHLELEHPVIILGQAGLWNGSRTQPMGRHGIRELEDRRAWRETHRGVRPAHPTPGEQPTRATRP